MIDAMMPMNESGPYSRKRSKRKVVAAEEEKSRIKIMGISSAGKNVP